MKEPRVSLYDHQSAEALDDALLGRLLKQAEAALRLMRQVPAGDQPVLDQLDEVEVSFIDDAEIARIHDKFMGIPGATDVITFHHGEILISTQTARRQAAEHGEPFERELLRYLVHGLLHLHGYTDAETAKRQAMHAIQEKLIQQLADETSG